MEAQEQPSRETGMLKDCPPGLDSRLAQILPAFAPIHSIIAPIQTSSALYSALRASNGSTRVARRAGM